MTTCTIHKYIFQSELLFLVVSPNKDKFLTSKGDIHNVFYLTVPGPPACCSPWWHPRTSGLWRIGCPSLPIPVEYLTIHH